MANLKSDNTALQNALSVSQQHESNLQGWIHDLESVLFRNGLASDVEGLRRIWSDRELKRSRPSIGGLPMNPAYPPPIQQQAPIDPLSTLARAASQLPTPSSNMYPKTQLPLPSLSPIRTGSDLHYPDQPPSLDLTRTLIPRLTSLGVHRCTTTSIRKLRFKLKKGRSEKKKG